MNQKVDRWQKVAKYKWAQVGPKRERFASLSVLLQVEDLPTSGWVQAPDKSLRLCVAGYHDEIDLRAKEIGSIWAIRSFKHVETSRLLVLWAIPTFSKDDATDWVSSLGRRVVANENVQLQPNDFENPIGLGEFSAVDNQIVRFTRFNEKTGRNRDIKVIAGNMESVVFVVRCLGDNEGWSWADSLLIASLQRKKIERKLSNGS